MPSRSRCCSSSRAVGDATGENRIEASGNAPRTARTEVRYDLVGAVGAGRAERVGRWRIEWTREAGSDWRTVGWTRSSRGAAWATTAYRRATLTATASTTSTSRNPPGCRTACPQPRRRDVRGRGGGRRLAVLDSTSQSLFADVDNDGDQDLILVTRSGSLLLLNDGKGHFTQVAGAFRTRGPVRGAPTSIAVADFDNDGFVDIDLCTYSYFIGASEDKAGTPTHRSPHYCL